MHERHIGEGCCSIASFNVLLYACARVTVNDELISFEQVQVRESKYVDFTLTEDTQKVSIEIYFW